MHVNITRVHLLLQVSNRIYIVLVHQNQFAYEFEWLNLRLLDVVALQVGQAAWLDGVINHIKYLQYQMKVHFLMFSAFDD